MRRYHNIYRLVSLVLLASFLTTLSGISAFAGHDCCGNCMPVSEQHPRSVEAGVIAADCCPAKTACECALQADGGMEWPVYSLARVSTASDDPLTGLAATASGAPSSPDLRPTSSPPRLMISFPACQPIYLTNQSFLC